MEAGGRKAEKHDERACAVAVWDVQSVLVAGGNAGIGRSAAESLAGLGATVHIMCRNREKGQKAVDDIKVREGGARGAGRAAER